MGIPVWARWHLYIQSATRPSASKIPTQLLLCKTCMINLVASYLNTLNIQSSFEEKNIPIHLTHWGQVTYVCIGKLTIIGSDNGLSPGRRQAIIWTNAGTLFIGPLGTNLSEILIGMQAFSFKKIHLKMSSAKWRPFCLSLNVLKYD